MPSAADVTYLIVLIGPGFVAMQLRAWTSEDYRITDTQRLTWSILVSLPIFFGLHGFLRVFPYKLGSMASPQSLLAEPFSAPLQFIAALYLIAAVSGYGIGRVLDSQALGGYLTRLKLDPTRHRDVWKAAFRDRQVVNLYLNDGTAFHGWAEENSSGLQDDKRFVRLIRVWRKRAGQTTWERLPRDEFVLVPADSISFIHFEPFVPATTPTKKVDEPLANSAEPDAASDPVARR